KEDLSGKPFVGPAGRVLDRALAEAGIPRTEVFVTNAVKHFKHEMRGKRRLHKRPNAYEIERCKIWLDLERALVKPVAIVALGAAQSARPFGHHREAARTGLASCRRHRLRHHPPLVPAAHRGRRRQAARVREFRRRSATGGADIAEKGGLIRPYSSSVNRPLTSASSASTTSAASRPLASTVIVVPGPAASIISPMIEVPPTTSWPRFTFTSASNFSTICTNFAEARACKPFLLQISSTRMMGAASDG